MRYGLEVRASVGLTGRTTSEYRDAHGPTYAGYLVFTVMREAVSFRHAANWPI